VPVDRCRESESVLHHSYPNLWESGNRAVAARAGAPGLFIITRIRACGNVGIARRFPRAVRRVANPGEGFARFPRTVISIGSAAAPARPKHLKNAVNSPCTAKRGEFSISPLDHRRYTVKHGAHAKMRLLM
jgi:hypothetical protein